MIRYAVKCTSTGNNITTVSYYGRYYTDSGNMQWRDTTPEAEVKELATKWGYKSRAGAQRFADKMIEWNKASIGSSHTFEIVEIEV